MPADGGRVVRAEYNWSAGNWLWIDHGNGLYSIYMHCSQFLVSIGQTVNRGDTIALMGRQVNRQEHIFISVCVMAVHMLILGDI